MAMLNPLMLGDLGAGPTEAAGKPGVEPSRTEVAGGLEAAVVGDLIDETVLLFRRLRSVAEVLHGDGALSGGRRNMLRELKRSGPQTVPQLARSRAVTRQHVQALVNPLEEQGYVEFIVNPAHRRSRLVGLTSSGEGLLDELQRRESGLLNALNVGASTEQVDRAVQVMRLVRKALAEWETNIEHPTSILDIRRWRRISNTDIRYLIFEAGDEYRRSNNEAENRGLILRSA